MSSACSSPPHSGQDMSEAPSSREKSSLYCRSRFSWGTLQAQHLRGQYGARTSNPRDFIDIGTIILTKLLDMLNIGGALLDLLLTNKKELVREWQSRAVESEIAALGILKEKVQLFLVGKQGLPRSGFFWDSRWVSNKQALAYSAATK